MPEIKPTHPEYSWKVHPTNLEIAELLGLLRYSIIAHSTATKKSVQVSGETRDEAYKKLNAIGLVSYNVDFEGFTAPRDYAGNHTAIFEVMHNTDLFCKGVEHQPDSTCNATRVRWINALREIVSRRMPVNKAGSPLTNDIDLFSATPEEFCEAFLKANKTPSADANKKKTTPKVQEVPTPEEEASCPSGAHESSPGITWSQPTVGGHGGWTWNWASFEGT